MDTHFPPEWALPPGDVLVTFKASAASDIHVCLATGSPGSGYVPGDAVEVVLGGWSNTRSGAPRPRERRAAPFASLGAMAGRRVRLLGERAVRLDGHDDGVRL